LQEQLRLLVELQKVDAALWEMKKKMEDVPRRLSELEAGLNAMKVDLERDRAELEEMKRDRRTKEGLLQMEVERVHRSEGRLKEIKTQKEYHALQKEIEQGKKLNAEREEDILRLISEIEERERSVAGKEEAFGVREEEYTRDKRDLEGEFSGLDKEFGSRKREWEELSKGIKPNILKVYQRVLEKRPDAAIVAARSGACTGCHMNLPPQLYNQIQKGNEMFQCPSCHRILYWEGSGVEKG
jgi:predicted  nucleic acid-binding Zn-ribbon protein